MTINKRVAQQLDDDSRHVRGALLAYNMRHAARLLREADATAHALKAIQDQLVESFYDPDPADVAAGTAEVDYTRVDWCGVVKGARQQIDELKGRI